MLLTLEIWNCKGTGPEETEQLGSCFRIAVRDDNGLEQSGTSDDRRIEK